MNRTCNILFLGGAKRVSGARMLIDAGKEMGVDVNLYSYEIVERLPIACVAKVIVGKRWRDADIYDDLHSVVERYGINVMIPFVDHAVAIVAAYRRMYGDVWAPVGSEDVAERMFDKSAAAVAFEEAGLPVPRTHRVGEHPHFPLIAKPRHGSASQGIVVMENMAQYQCLTRVLDNYLVQEYIENRQEFTLDCYATMDGEVLCTGARHRLEVTGGEVTRTVSVSEPRMEEAARKAIVALGLRGAVTVQFMREPSTGRVLIMEINPRLGGGVVCTIHAGAPIHRYIIAEAMGRRDLLVPAEVKPGVEIVRYPQEVVFGD